jgi:hypothetical protein
MSGTEYDIEMLIKGSWEYQFSKGDQFMPKQTRRLSRNRGT